MVTETGALSRNSCKAREARFSGSYVFSYRFLDSCIGPYPYDTGVNLFYSLCADYGTAGNGHGLDSITGAAILLGGAVGFSHIAPVKYQHDRSRRRLVELPLYSGVG